MTINDAHCHFFSESFFRVLGVQRGWPPVEAAAHALAALNWEAPGPVHALAARWARALDDAGVSRAALIASVPGDEDSVAAAVAAHPTRLVGYFMFDPTRPDAAERLARAAASRHLRVMCLFPAMQGYGLAETRVAEAVATWAARPTSGATFVHCGVLSVGARAKLGLKSAFHPARGNPLDLQPLAASHPEHPFIVPHFGAGLLRELLLVATVCPNIHVDTSSSNQWKRAIPDLTLAKVFERAIEVVGPSRLLFGSDSSYFPRGWHAEVLSTQRVALAAVGVSEADQSLVLGGNFDRLFPIEA